MRHAPEPDPRPHAHTPTPPPGKPYHVYAGREVARALAVGSLQEDDCCGGLDGLAPEQLQLLREKVADFDLKYDEVGQVSRAPVLHRTALKCVVGLRYTWTRQLLVRRWGSAWPRGGDEVGQVSCAARYCTATRWHAWRPHGRDVRVGGGGSCGRRRGERVGGWLDGWGRGDGSGGGPHS